jgi:hypothetical protein
VEPEWRFIAGICNCPALMPEQVGVAAGLWQRPGDEHASISMRIHTIADAEHAARWMAERADFHPDGWTTATYPVADGGYMSRYRDDSRVEITFRSGPLLLFVSAGSEADAKRFAHYLLVSVTVIG